MIKNNRHLMTVAIVAFTIASAGRCWAAPEEIQVYMDDLSEPGQFGMDVHNNYVISGDSTEPYPGGQPPMHVYRLTPEFYYGLSRSFELGFYILSTHEPDQSLQINGAKVRLKYIAPHDATRGFYWGANVEVGKTDQRVSETPWNSELKAIFGYRSGLWTYAITPNIELPLSAGGGPATGEIHSKIAYAVSSATLIGFESYNELGPVKHFESFSSTSQTLYAVIDHEFKSFDLNAGIGHGLTDASDEWIFKFIVGRISSVDSG